MKNTLTIAITTTKIYEFYSTQPTADLAFDQYFNCSRSHKKFMFSTENIEIQDFKINEPKKRKPKEKKK
jgi:hypothetical protein